MQQAINRLVCSDHAAVFKDVTNQENDGDDSTDDILLSHKTRDDRKRDELIHVKLGVRESLRAKTKDRIAKNRERGDDSAKHRPRDSQIGLVRTQPTENSAEDQANTAEENEREPPFHSALGMIVPAFAEATAQMFAFVIVFMIRVIVGVNR
jgi:hypothetical protein